MNKTPFLSADMLKVVDEWQARAARFVEEVTKILEPLQKPEPEESPYIDGPIWRLVDEGWTYDDLKRPTEATDGVTTLHLDREAGIFWIDTEVESIDAYEIAMRVAAIPRSPQ